MKTDNVFGDGIIRVAIADAVLVSAACLLPALSHMVSFPLFLFDPMRLLVLAGLFWTANRKNALLLAVALPLLSFFFSGYPTLPKTMLIAGELAVNVLLFVWLGGKMRSVFLSMLLSVLLSKVFYYLLKWLLLPVLFPESPLFGHGLPVQVAVAVAFAALFAAGEAWRRNR